MSEALNTATKKEDTMESTKENQKHTAGERPDDAFELFDLEVSVEGDESGFVCSHEKGPAFRVVGENIVFDKPGRFSLYALAALLPLLPARERPTHENDWITTDSLIACPDPYCTARFRIRRTRRRTFSHAECTVVPPEGNDPLERELKTTGDAAAKTRKE